MSEARVAFEEALVAIAPAGLDRVLLGLSGSDANDTALKLARTLTGRHEVIAFSGGYFGRGSGVIGLNGKARMRAAAGRDADAHFLPYPYPYRWPLGPGDGAGETALALVRHALEDPASGIGPVAAIVVEPVQGNGGVVIPPDGFLAGLRELCDRHGAVLIFDEVQCGLRADGPDLGGRALGRRPGPDDRRQGHRRRAGPVGGRRAAGRSWPTGRRARTPRRSWATRSTWRPGGRPSASCVTRASSARSATLGARLLERLRAALADDAHVGEVRGLGLFVGIEIVADRDDRTPDPDRTAGSGVPRSTGACCSARAATTRTSSRSVRR